jgi:hypothetical protein
MSYIAYGPQVLKRHRHIYDSYCIFLVDNVSLTSSNASVDVRMQDIHCEQFFLLLDVTISCIHDMSPHALAHI